MTQLETKFYNYYLKNKQCEARVSKGVVDEIYPAIFRRDLEDAFDASEIKFMQTVGLLEEKLIKTQNGMVRSVYVFKKDMLKQVTWYKKLLERFILLFHPKGYRRDL